MTRKERSGLDRLGLLVASDCGCAVHICKSVEPVGAAGCWCGYVLHQWRFPLKKQAMCAKCVAAWDGRFAL